MKSLALFICNGAKQVACRRWRKRKSGGSGC